MNNHAIMGYECITRATCLVVGGEGKVQTLICDDVCASLAAFATDVQHEKTGSLVTLSWEQETSVSTAVQQVTRGLARIALARWPGWYGAGVTDAVGAEPVQQALHRASEVGARKVEGPGTVNSAWIKAAGGLCEQGRLPLPKGYAHAAQAAQLARTVADDDLLLCLPLVAEAPSAESLLAFARVAEWCAKVTGARVLALVPTSLATQPQLDSILYGAKVYSPPFTGRQASIGDEPPKVVLPPILGSPHPSSPGEQLLANALEKDRELAGLFAFNQPLELGAGERFVVDCLWRDGGLVVEVDGYRWHSSVTVFSSDRYRDYRLMLHGYLVLRLPHDEVMDDVVLQVEKIRDMVRFVQRRGEHDKR